MLEVFCLFLDDVGYNVFQRNLFDSSTNFYTTWAEYKAGFGDKTKGFWLGNEAIHHLAAKSSRVLLIQLWNQHGQLGQGKYTGFGISDESDRYRLSLQANSFTGTIGDSIANVVGKCKREWIFLLLPILEKNRANP